MFKRVSKKEEADEIYYRDSLMSMSYGSRLSVRILMNAWVIIHVSATVVLTFSDVPWAFWLGILNALYLLDRLIRYGDGDRDLPIDNEDVGNLASYLSPRARRIILSSYNKASIVGGGFFLNIARALTEVKSVQNMLNRLEVDRGEIDAKLDAYLGKEAAAYKDRVRLLGEVEHLVLAAFHARVDGQRFIDYADLFAALESVGSEELSSLFSLFDVDESALQKAAIFGRLQTGAGPAFGGGSGVRLPFRRKHRIMNRAWTARPTPILDSFSTDLTDLARAGAIGFLIGHEDEYKRLIDILSRSAKPNVLLVGDAGVGKRAIVERLAYMMVKNQVPEELSDKRLVSLDVGGLVAGADQGEIQGRIRDVFKEIYRAGNVVIFVPNIHNLSRTSDAHVMSAASNVLPLIASQDFPTVGSTTPREFKQLIEPDSLFGEAFEDIQVEEISNDEAAHILSYKALGLEAKYKVTIAYKAIRVAVDLSKKYFHDKPLPSSAEDLLRETISYTLNREDKVVTSDDVVAVAEEKVNIPIHEVEGGEAKRLLNLEKLIHERLVDQEEAVKAVSGALRTYRSGLAASGGPIGTFLFVGPTGVGKTELAKTLSQIQFGSEEAMVRFDMSEYQDTESIHRLIGSPDGKVSGSLTDAILDRPYSLLLLDEFEKAHRDILELFLQVFDDGRLTDNLDRTVSFENTIIIATSNAEARFVLDQLRSGQSMDDISEELKTKLTSHFSPELLNRFSAVVVFKSLSEDDIKAIARIHLASLANQLKETNDITLLVDEDLVAKIAEMGYDETFGARPLERTISDKLRDPLSKKILAEEIKKGMKISVRVKNEVTEIHEA